MYANGSGFVAPSPSGGPEVGGDGARVDVEQSEGVCEILYRWTICSEVSGVGAAGVGGAGW